MRCEVNQHTDLSCSSRRPRTPPFQGENTGSIPVHDSRFICCGVGEPGRPRGFHTPKIAGSNPAPATSNPKRRRPHGCRARKPAAKIGRPRNSSPGAIDRLRGLRRVDSPIECWQESCKYCSWIVAAGVLPGPCDHPHVKRGEWFGGCSRRAAGLVSLRPYKLFTIVFWLAVAKRRWARLDRWPRGPRRRLAKPWSRKRPAGSNPARSASFTGV